MNATYDSEEVIGKLESYGCVSVNLEGNSEVCQQFSQIYPVVLIPSTYFIGTNGMLLEIIGGDLTTEEFLTKIDTILKVNFSSAPEAEQNRASNRGDAKSNEQSSRGSLSPNDTHENSPSNELAPEVSSTGSQNSVNVDERVERAKQLLIQQKQQKAKLEMETKKRKALERRKSGQEVHKLKQRQQDAETKQLADGLARERAEEKAARERIKDQIAKDRAERAAKYQAEKQETERVKSEAQQRALQEQQEKAAMEAAERSDSARLQFQFPDGSSLTHQFSADDTLDVVRQHVQDSSRMSRSFTPRREFQDDDYNSTLRELRLAPCSAILVLPQTAVASSNNLGFIWTLLGPILALFNYLRVLVFGRPSTTAGGSAAQARPSSNANKRNNDDSSSSSSKGAKTDGSQQNVHKRRPGNPGPNFSRREGNIHRISNHKDDEDDNNTWNGNSTQQM